MELAAQRPAITEEEELIVDGSVAQEYVRRSKGNRRTLAWLLGITAVVLFGAAILLYVKPALSPKVTGSTQLTSGNDPRYIIVTDGPRLFFRVNRREGGAIAEMSTAGGDISILPTPTTDPAIYDISPDHSHLLLTQTTQDAAQIWNMPLPVGAPQKIGDMDVGGASWFPDGQHLLLLRKGVFYVANPDGSGLRRFLTGLPKGIIFWG